jgi:hypothetical protein
VAFGIRVQAIRASNGEQVLPAIANENYFSLMPGETKTVKIEFDADVLGDDSVKLTADPYNNNIQR